MLNLDGFGLGPTEIVLILFLLGSPIIGVIIGLLIRHNKKNKETKL